MHPAIRNIAVTAIAALAALAAIAALVTLVAAPANAQSFLKVTDPTNPIVTGGGPAPAYAGVSWPDADGDGDVDLFVNGVGLFRNDGGGVFVHLPVAVPPMASTFANTWADADNDGDLDVFVTGGAPNGSVLFLNQGGLVFNPVVTGPIADANATRAWGCAFGDYDADGLVDVVTAAANGFAGIANPNRLFHNEGGGSFTSVDTAAFVQSLGPYTIPTWSDFDLDGDLDLFIGTGPADGTTALDFLYTNRNESSPAWFQRYLTPPLGTDLQDGQIYNWIDFDNDRDLDVYLTNYSGPTGGMVNRLYRNDGGTFVRLTAAQAGTIAGDQHLSLASVWQDFDNDGDLDCVVTNDGGFSNRFYRNNGGGAFSSVTIPNLTATGPHYGAASGDYDQDGRMDLFIAGDATTFALFRNVTPNGFGWLDVRLTGTVSNRAAIGARVRVLATIGGSPRWQLREISAQNSFNGMNALDAHFGLGAATVVDSVVVEWPSGIVNTRANVAINGRIDVTEEQGMASVPPGGGAAVALGRVDVVPNPVAGAFRVRLALATAGDAEVRLLDVAGRVIDATTLRDAAAGTRDVALAAGAPLGAGIYFVQVQRGAQAIATRFVVLR